MNHTQEVREALQPLVNNLPMSETILDRLTPRVAAALFIVRSGGNDIYNWEETLEALRG